MLRKRRLLTCKTSDEQQDQERWMDVDWVSQRLLLSRPHRRSREFFITFRQTNPTQQTQHLGQRINADAPPNRRLTSSSRPLTTYTSSVSAHQPTMNNVSGSVQTNDYLQRSRKCQERAIEKEGVEDTPQLTRGRTSAGNAHECPRVVGLPGKEWVRLIRANPQDPALRRLDATNNSVFLSSASSNGRVDNQSTGCRSEATSGCGSLTGRRFPTTLYPLPSFEVMRTKPSNAAIGDRNRSSVASLFQQSCERIFTSNRFRYKWNDTGSGLLPQERFQQRKREEELEQEEPPRCLGVYRFKPDEDEYFQSKAPNNSPAPDDEISEHRLSDSGNDDQKNDDDDTDYIYDDVKEIDGCN